MQLRGMLTQVLCHLIFFSILFYEELFDNTLEDTNIYYKQYITTRRGISAPPQDITMNELYKFLALTL